jgi:hypothetical protein
MNSLVFNSGVLVIKDVSAAKSGLANEKKTKPMTADETYFSDNNLLLLIRKT